MLSCEENNKKRPTQQQSILFTPRQVILSNPTMKQQQKQLTSDQRVLLYHSISHFLELNGFLKSLSKFRKETHLEKDSWKSSSLNLEEIFQEYLQKCNDEANVPNVKQKDGDVSAEIVKGAKENEVDDGKKSNGKLDNNAVSGDNVKSKKKKKETKDIYSSKHLNGEVKLKENDHPVEDVKKVKDKKKKHKDEPKPLEKELLEKKVEDAAGQPSEKENDVPKKEKSKSKKSKEETSVEKDETEKEKKSSKKRKKSSSDDNENDHAEEAQTDDSKRRKTDDSVQFNGTEQAPKTPKGSDNGDLESGAKKFEKLNKTKELNDSAEPKSANAFRRVKADEVEFADERLQDNSYWAKHGADSGYGAKAQEVLGQVRGRDFRHEKTKKKRGSYRGGQIDLQSHSIKFNYEDDDE